MECNSYGISKARLRSALRSDTRPAGATANPLQNPASGGSTDTFVIAGMQISPTTRVVIIADAAQSDETATITAQTVTRSSLGAIGSISVDVTYVNLPGVQAGLFQVFLVDEGKYTHVDTIAGAA